MTNVQRKEAAKNYYSQVSANEILGARMSPTFKGYVVLKVYNKVADYTGTVTIGIRPEFDEILLMVDRAVYGMDSLKKFTTPEPTPEPTPEEEPTIKKVTLENFDTIKAGDIVEQKNGFRTVERAKYKVIQVTDCSIHARYVEDVIEDGQKVGENYLSVSTFSRGSRFDRGTETPYLAFAMSRFQSEFDNLPGTPEEEPTTREAAATFAQKELIEKIGTNNRNPNKHQIAEEIAQTVAAKFNVLVTISEKAHSGAVFTVKHLKSCSRVNYRCGYGRHNYAPVLEIIEPFNKGI